MAPSCGLVEGREGGKGRFRAKKTCAPPKSPETGPNRQGTWLFRERQRAWCRVPIFRARADGLVCPPRCCSSACAWPQYGNTALIKAAREEHTATVEALIKAGANLDLQNNVSDSRTSPPPRLPQNQGFFYNSVDICPSRWRLFCSTQFRAKIAEKMPQNKTTPFVRQRCAIGAVVTRVGNRASVAEIWPFEIWLRAEGGGGGVGPFCDPP